MITDHVLEQPHPQWLLLCLQAASGGAGPGTVVAGIPSDQSFSGWAQRGHLEGWLWTLEPGSSRGDL